MSVKMNADVCGNPESDPAFVFRDNQLVDIRNAFMKFCVTWIFLISAAIVLYVPVRTLAAEMCVLGFELM